MKLTDLKLLIECCAEGHVEVVHGYIVAKERLLRAKLIEENPHWLNLVRPTNAGFKFVEKLQEVEP